MYTDPFHGFGGYDKSIWNHRYRQESGCFEHFNMLLSWDDVHSVTIFPCQIFIMEQGELFNIQKYPCVSYRWKWGKR